MSLLSECLWRKSGELASVAPLGERRKSDFQRKAFGAPNPPSDFRESRAHWALHWCSVPCPEGSLGACGSLAARLCGEAGPGALLCIASCALYLVGGINGVFSLSGVRAALLASTESTLQWRESPFTWTQSPSQISSRPLENAGKLPFRKLGFPPGLSHYHRGWRYWEQGDGASHPPGRIPLVRLMWCWGTVLSFLPIKIVLVLWWLRVEVTYNKRWPA